MATFTDRNNKSWSLNLTVGHLAPLKETYGLDLNKAVRSQEDFASLFDLAPQDLVGILYHVCEEAIEKAGLSPEDWAHLFDGETIERATTALAEAVLSFFPRQKIAQAMTGNLRKALEKMDRQAVKQIEKMGNQEPTLKDRMTPKKK
jgi:hypothetical protein